MSTPVDARSRARALDPAVSFVVQAPAGSGKTELLTRRILTLLATVEEPEQVVAITFTKKAAAEMRQRVVELLRAAHEGSVPADDYEAAGLELAARVLDHDAARGWDLLDDPQRLALGTIDSLTTRLAHRLPLTSTLGAPTGVVEDARDLYLEAAGRFVEERLGRLDLVLLRLGNRFERLQGLLADLLGVRDQWMRFVMPYAGTGEALRERLEEMLENLIDGELRALVAACPPYLQEELPPIARRAARWLVEQAVADSKSLDTAQRALVDALDALESLPGAALDDLPVWCALASFLLTKTGTRRVSIDKRSGFPAKTKPAVRALDTDEASIAAHKADMMSLLERLGDESEFVERLHAIRNLPSSRYADADWAVLEQLVGLLPELVAELHLLFGERGRLDFSEIAQRAVTALGTEEQPTDLALSMDMDLRHVLVDEFQDTSRAQWSLFERLVAGWEPGDGRTFFIVGDPMQSIYRFREGDVALFLEARDHGIGPVRFESLRLEVNFRSGPPIIDWVNETFADLFPDIADPNVGAVTYEASTAFGDADDGAVSTREPSDAPETDRDGVHVHALSDATPEAEAAVVAELVRAALECDPTHTVGILVRSRGSARHVVAALHAADVRFRAVEMEPLGERPVVRDLIALTLALRFPHDRLNWLAVLRGPLCGLTLRDLHALVGDDTKPTVLEQLGKAERVARLGDDGRRRVARFVDVVGPAVERSSRSSLVPWVEAIWLRLGGVAACTAPGDIDAAERCLARLVEFERDGRIWRRGDVVRSVEKLYAADPPDEEASRVQLMTVHKSKGLEFDTVILPALDRQPKPDASRLINWHESTFDGEPHLLFAPIDPPNVQHDRRNLVVRLVRERRARAETEERRRLLYVACTRARRRLHLSARLVLDEDGRPKTPRTTTFLNALFDVVCAAHDAAPIVTPDTGAPPPPSGTGAGERSGPRPAPPSFLRTGPSWRLPAFDRFEWQQAKPLAKADPAIDRDGAGEYARDVGTVTHRALLQLSRLPMDDRCPPDEAARRRFSLELENLGVHATYIDEAVERVVLAVTNTLADERGLWILDSGHGDARSEWAVTVPELDDGRFVGVRRVVIDRTFVDADDVRWVIDYKTGSHEGGEVEEFLDAEVERYRAQLEGYADVVGRMDTRKVRVGLWFPMIRGWRELCPTGAERATLV